MRSITADELREIMEASGKVPVINVLPPESFAEAHIPGSHNVPVGDPNFERQVEDLVDTKSDPVVVYCASESCDASPKAARKLEGAGFSEVMDFQGGMEAWKDAGYEVA